jgi:hypothetical protein|tara:strand:+ start:218 stop:835 length:618 start_codon:yes stop_codon:yes gene_type:complete
MKNYYSIYDDLKTGDLIFFSGKGFVARVIRFFSGCEYSHVGMVLVLKIKNKRELAILESNGKSFIVDYHTGQFKSGVSIVNLTTKLHSYNGKMGIKQLSKPMHETHKSKMESLICHLRHLGYTMTLYGLLSSVFKLKPDEEVKSLFCSQLIVIILKRIGLIKTDIPPEWYTPCELSFIDKLNDEYSYLPLDELSLSTETDSINIL